MSKKIGTRIQDNFWENTIPVPECGCLLWERWTDKDGYGQCQFEGKQQGTHRVAWQLANGPIPQGLHVLHSCDTPTCVNPRHLFLGTEKENCQDAFKKNRRISPSVYILGEKHPRAKLTEAQVREARESNNETTAELALKYGVSHKTMTLARRGLTWKSLS